MQVKSSLSAKSKSKAKSSSLKESTGASNIHPLIDMSKLLQSQVRKGRVPVIIQSAAFFQISDKGSYLYDVCTGWGVPKKQTK